MSTEPERYDLGYDVREGRDVIEQHDAGDYVLFSDYEAEQRRWQDEIRDLLCKIAPHANIDGAGCDSGDPLDVTRAEIKQAFAHWVDKIQTT